MIYPESFEQKIKFKNIRSLVKEQCISPLGKEEVDAMQFYTDFGFVKTLLYQTSEFVRILQEEENFPLGYFIDVREPLARIRVEGRFMEEDELFSLKRSLTTVKDIAHFFSSKEEDEYPYLKEKTKDIQVFPLLIERIDSILNKHGKIKDNASPELARIRRDIRNKQQSISGKLSAILKQIKKSGYTDADVSVAIRDGRAVIPVNSAYKRKINGIIHDESATGKTTFIEPAEVVEINNEVRELEYAERREVVKILIDTADIIRPYIDDVKDSFRFLGEIDFIRAKAKFALNINALLPEITDSTDFDWVQAIHPLLYLQHTAAGKEVVPLDIRLTTPDKRILLISGPNAGGKSVCLQTVGLLQYMLQCGMLVPVDEQSKMGFYKNIFIDMGDEQSIENDLSTYSSHLMNMKFFIHNSNKETLLLIDEFGTGTEPMLGGAIAEAVLGQLNKQEVYGVITTHYTNLKHFATETEGIENGAMLFDTHRIQPLFKLQIGQPGSSFAFEIARKIGLPEEILKEAQEKIGQEHIDFDKHLREIVRDKRYWEQKRNNIRINDKRLSETLGKYQKALQDVKKERKEILEQAKTEAERMLAEANKKIENTIKAIREAQAEKEKTRTIRKDLERFKQEKLDRKTEEQSRIDRKIEKLKERERRKADRKNKKENSQTKEPKTQDDGIISKGDFVKLQGQPVPGEVIDVTGKEAVVAFGNMVTTVKLTRLEKISSNAYKKQVKTNSQSTPATSVAERIRNTKLNFKPDIDIRGMRANDAIDRVMQHLDEAIIAETPTVKILHGKGDGILRQMIREYLGTLPFVKSFRDEHVQYGGSGITIVELDI
ncbi:MAG: endonuclease MutS2 [Chlorobi bacterium]|nr:endonuclease MutS2 [Chlorobiota bacterium]